MSRRAHLHWKHRLTPLDMTVDHSDLVYRVLSCFPNMVFRKLRPESSVDISYRFRRGPSPLRLQTCKPPTRFLSALPFFEHAALRLDGADDFLVVVLDDALEAVYLPVFPDRVCAIY